MTKIKKFGELPLNFVFADENTGREYRFDDLNCTQDEFMDWVETFDYDSLETTYGVHDFSGGESDDEIVVGFSSYEISKKDFVTVMEIWRKGLVDAGFISPEQEVKIIEHPSFNNINPVIVFYNSLTDYYEKYEVERIGLEEFQEDYADDFVDFMESKLTKYGFYEFDGVDGDNENEYTIQIDDDEQNWKENLDKAIQKVIQYFQNLQIDLTKISE